MVTKRIEAEEPGKGAKPHRKRSVDRTLVHRDYFKRRLEGGAPATPEAYARAIEQWQELPGAVRSVRVTDLTQDQAAPKPADTGGLAPSHEGPDEE